MRMTIRVAAAAFGLAGALVNPARAQEAPVAVIDYANAMNAVAQRIDQQIAERQKGGDIAAAQRLVLAAAMIRRVAEEFRGAEQSQLPYKVSDLPAPLPARTDAALAEATQLEHTAADQPGFVEGALSTFAALLTALPTVGPHPVLYGLLSDDLVGAGPHLKSDVVIYGFRLTDPVLYGLPTVLFDKKELPAADVVVKDDRIEVTLPDYVKKAVDFAPPPCDSRGSFALRVHESHALQRGVWPLVWRSTVQNNTDVYALPTPVIYAAQVVVSTESVAATTHSVNFRQLSDLAIAECEKTQAVEIKAPLPADATDANCQAAWIDTAGASKIASQCTIEGHYIHATGVISAGAKVCSPEKICACTARAQGWLEATGSYKVLQPGGEVKTTAETISTTFPAGGLAETQLPARPGEVMRHAAIAISRRACDKISDTIDLSVADDPDASHSGDSKTGTFRAVLKKRRLTVGAADAFPTDIDKTP